MNISPISFGKKYIDTAPVYNLNRNRDERFDFVEYEDAQEDKDKVSETLDEWIGWGADHSYLFHDMSTGLIVNSSSRFFGLEDENEETQALAQIEITGSGKNKNLELEYALTNPKNAHGSYAREYAGLGKALFKKVIETAIDEGCKSISLDDVSEGFWDSLPCFRDQRGFQDKVLKSDKFEQALDLLG